ISGLSRCPARTHNTPRARTNNGQHAHAPSRALADITSMSRVSSRPHTASSPPNPRRRECRHAAVYARRELALIPTTSRVCQRPRPRARRNVRVLESAAQS
ncbi:Unknown protein, partial [Striga hermonthica]